MEEHNLLILVTRLSGEVDEWRFMWRFPPTSCIAFVHDGSLTLCDASALAVTSANARFTEEDVWIINGGDFRNRAIQGFLSKVEWGAPPRPFKIQVHFGQGQTALEFGLEQFILHDYPDLAEFVRRAGDYSLGGTFDADTPIGKFAQVVAQGTWTRYAEVLRSLRFGTVLPGQKLRVLHHRLVNVLLAIDTDIQGWTESSFSSEYGCELVGQYKDGYGEKELAKASAIVYGEPGDDSECVEALFLRARRLLDADRLQVLNLTWATVEEIWPRPGERETQSPLFQNAKSAVMSLTSVDGLESLKRLLAENNSFHDWFIEVDRALGGLIDTVCETEAEVYSPIRDEAAHG